MGLSRLQRRYLRHWSKLILAGEILLFAAGRKAEIVFFLAGAAFFFALLLRILHKYPGSEEPLLLDFASGLLAFLAGGVFACFRAGPGAPVLKIVFPPIILLPHFFYIARMKDPPATPLP